MAWRPHLIAALSHADTCGLPLARARAHREARSTSRLACRPRSPCSRYHALHPVERTIRRLVHDAAARRRRNELRVRPHRVDHRDVARGRHVFLPELTAEEAASCSTRVEVGSATLVRAPAERRCVLWGSVPPGADGDGAGNGARRARRSRGLRRSVWDYGLTITPKTPLSSRSGASIHQWRAVVRSARRIQHEHADDFPFDVRRLTQTSMYTDGGVELVTSSVGYKAVLKSPEPAPGWSIVGVDCWSRSLRLSQSQLRARRSPTACREPAGATRRSSTSLRYGVRRST